MIQKRFYDIIDTINQLYNIRKVIKWYQFKEKKKYNALTDKFFDNLNHELDFPIIDVSLLQDFIECVLNTAKMHGYKDDHILITIPKNEHVNQIVFKYSANYYKANRGVEEESIRVTVYKDSLHVEYTGEDRIEDINTITRLNSSGYAVIDAAIKKYFIGYWQFKFKS